MDRYLELGKAIARSIMSVGDEPNDKAHRIAFKGGTYPEGETDLGGLCEVALAAHIRGVLIDRNVFGEFKDQFREGASEK